MFPSATPFLPQVYSVARVQRESADVCTLTLEQRDGGLQPPAPGQFNMLYAFGVGEVPISLSATGKRGETVHTIRSVGQVSSALCRLRRGDAIGVRGPYGRPWPLATMEGHDLLIVAGGLGLAPLRPVIHHLMRNRSQYGRVAVFYGARSPDAMIYRRELERLRGRFDVEVEVTVDHATPEWRGNVGVLPKLIGRAAFTPADALALVCGPEVMVRFVYTTLERSGVGQEQVYVSLERNMKCAIGMCGRCQFGPSFVCKDGPVFRYDEVAPRLAMREV